MTVGKKEIFVDVNLPVGLFSCCCHIFCELLLVRVPKLLPENVFVSYVSVDICGLTYFSFV